MAWEHEYDCAGRLILACSTPRPRTMAMNTLRRPAALRLLLSLRQQDWLALMLLGLHVALAFGIDAPLSKAFLLFHFGCFLLWQPVWRGEQRVYVGQAVLIVGAAALLVVSSNWWLIALWLAVLFALI